MLKVITNLKRSLLMIWSLTLLPMLMHHAHAGQNIPSAGKPIATLEKLSENAAINKVVNYLNSDMPSVQDIQNAFTHLGIPSTLHATILFGVIKRLLNPSQSTTINVAASPIPQASQKAELIMEQLLPWYIQQATRPQEAMRNALLVMVLFADYVPYWNSAVSDFITFIENQRTFIPNLESYLNELIFMIVLRKNIWNRADKIDFMINMHDYITRQAAARLPRQQKKYRAALRESVQRAAQESAADTGPTHKRTAVDAGFIPQPDAFGLQITNLLSYLIDATQTNPSHDTKLNATTKLVYGETFTYPIFLIAISGNQEALSIALQAGADINAINSEGINALTFAVEEELIDMIPVLLKNGARIAAWVVRDGEQEYIYNAFDDAIEHNQIRMVLMLIAYGSSQISNQMLSQGIARAQEFNNNSILAILKREVKRRVYKKIITAIQTNDTATIKKTVLQVRSHIDKDLIRRARIIAQQENTLPAYEMLSTYKALFDAISASKVDIVKQLLESKAQYIDLEMLGYLLQAANKNGYPPLINLVTQEINVRQQLVNQQGIQQ